MNENSKPLKKKFNIIDFLLIVLIIAALISVLLRNDVTSTLNVGQKMTDVEFTFIVENIRDISCDKFAEGKEFLLQSNDKSIGTLTSYEVLPYEQFMELSSGEIVKSQVPNRYTLKGTVKTQVYKGEDGYYLEDNVFLSPGSTFYVKFDILYFMISVISVNETPAS